MSATFVLVPIFILAVFAGTKSQVYTPYNQYGYPYYPRQDAVYTPYPYQPYVSSQPISYVPNYVNYVQPSYPVYGYAYPNQQSYYPYTYPQYQYPAANTVNNGINNPVSNNRSEGEDPYANIKVDVIDIEPKNFHYYKKFFNLEDNAYPVQVIEDDSVRSSTDAQGKPQTLPYYTVKTDSTSYNYSSVPQGVSIHDVKSKTYSFKRTFTLDPTKKENAVINLNFVNGVQVTTEQPQGDSAHEEDTIPPVVTEENVPTTTDNDKPDPLVSWFK